jgi:hypothetical protein
MTTIVPRPFCVGFDTCCVIGVISTGKLFLKGGKKFITGKVFSIPPYRLLLIAKLSC